MVHFVYFRNRLGRRSYSFLHWLFLQRYHSLVSTFFLRLIYPDFAVDHVQQHVEYRRLLRGIFQSRELLPHRKWHLQLVHVREQDFTRQRVLPVSHGESFQQTLSFCLFYLVGRTSRKIFCFCLLLFLERGQISKHYFVHYFCTKIRSGTKSINYKTDPTIECEGTTEMR